MSFFGVRILIAKKELRFVYFWRRQSFILRKLFATLSHWSFWLSRVVNHSCRSTHFGVLWLIFWWWRRRSWWLNNTSVSRIHKLSYLALLKTVSFINFIFFTLLKSHLEFVSILFVRYFRLVWFFRKAHIIFNAFNAIFFITRRILANFQRFKSP